MSVEDLLLPNQGDEVSAATLRALISFAQALARSSGMNCIIDSTGEVHFRPLPMPVNGPIRLHVKEVFNDYLRCVTWDGTTAGTADIFVAKPPTLRHDEAQYADLSSLTTVTASTVTTVGAATETWKVTPDYIVDKEIWAVPGPTGVLTAGSVPIVFMDDNRAGRFWGVSV